MDEEKQERTEANSLEGCPEPLLPVLQGLTGAFADVDFDFYFFRGEATVTTPSDKAVDVLTYLKDTKEHAFDYLVDVGGLHDPEAKHELVVFYNLLSISTNRRIRVKTWCEGNPPMVQSVTGLFEAANWHERETYDMFGIRFQGHPDHRRMFLPEHVDFHPLRKDYPLRGDNDKPYY